MLSRITVSCLAIILTVSMICCSRTIPNDTQSLKKTTAGKESQGGETMGTRAIQDESVLQPTDTAEYYMARLESEDKGARLEAVQKLKQLGPQAGNAVDALIKTLRIDKEKELRSGAADALSAIGEKALPSIPILIFALRDEAWEVRLHAARALGSFKADAADALNALNTILENEKVEEVKKEIESAIKAISEG